MVSTTADLRSYSTNVEVVLNLKWRKSNVTIYRRNVWLEIWSDSLFTVHQTVRPHAVAQTAIALNQAWC